jgi:hypothetical protein
MGVEVTSYWTVRVIAVDVLTPPGPEAVTWMV